MRRLLFPLCLLILSGCASVNTTEEWESIRSFSADRSGGEARWEQTDEDRLKTAADVETLIADGLSEDDAVRIALLNNRTLQARFEDIGIAKADLVQAGLFTNPSLSALFLFPLQDKGFRTEGDALFSISDFWKVPVRKRVAKAGMEETILAVSDEILRTEAEARKAHVDCVALHMLMHEGENLLRESESMKEQILYRAKFGFSSELDIAMAQAAAAEQEMLHGRIKRDYAISLLTLERVLGLNRGRLDNRITGALADVTPGLPDGDRLVRLALEQRPDVLQARMRVEAARHALDLEQRSIFGDVKAGGGFEHERHGADKIGPRIDLTLPIFDQNQAAIAKARYRLRRSEKELQSLEGKVRDDVFSGMERLWFLRQEALLIRDKVLPAGKRAEAYAEKYSSAMQVNMLVLFEARKKSMEISQRSINVLREYRHQQIELERIAGGAVKGVTAPAAPPSGGHRH